MKKEIPILFSTPMVQSTMDGRKTKTRRVRGLEYLNNDPDNYIWLKDYNQMDIPRVAVPYDDRFYYAFTGKYNNSSLFVTHCPYGKPGDLLWVRESFCTGLFSDDDVPGYIHYKASHSADIKGIWKPSIHMPKDAARIWLEVTDVRVERLQDISEEEAIAEGIDQQKHEFEMMAFPNGEIEQFDPKPVVWQRRNYLNNEGGVRHYQNFSAKECFQTLWQSINGEESWEQNPWVWVISFKVLSTNGKPKAFTHLDELRPNY